MNKPIGPTFDKNSSVDSDESNPPSQSTLPNLDYHKNNFQKYKKYCSRQAPTGKWCDYHNSAWHDTP